MMIYAKNTKTGFTLIELLVVISIISLLSSVVLASLNTARTKARIAKAKQEMSFFAKAVSISSGESYKTLMTMSANGGATIPNCSSCHAACTGDLRNVLTSNGCYVEWNAVLSGVQSNSNGLISSLTTMTRDPWGSPYLLDQNQGKAGNCAATNLDVIFSVGPDGTRSTSDDVYSPTPIPVAPRCP